MPGGSADSSANDLLGRLLLDRRAALVAMRRAQPGHQQPQMVVDLGHRGHGAARILAAGPLIDRNRRLQALDQIDVGPLQLMQELPGVDRQAFDILPLPFGIQRVEGQRAFARTAGAGDHHQPVAGNIEIDILQIMDPGAANADRFRLGRRWTGTLRRLARYSCPHPGVAKWQGYKPCILARVNMRQKAASRYGTHGGPFNYQGRRGPSAGVTDARESLLGPL